MIVDIGLSFLFFFYLLFFYFLDVKKEGETSLSQRPGR